MELNYTKPIIVKAAKGWFVKYFVGKKEYREKLGLNRIADLKEREAEFQKLRTAVERRLEREWRPVKALPTYYIDDTFAKSMTLTAALDFAMDKKRLKAKKKTILDYDCTIRFVKSAIIALGYQSLPVNQTKRIHIKMLMEHVKVERKWSAYAYNKNMGYLQGVLKELVKWYIIEVNPAHSQERYEEQTKEPRRTATPDEYSKIKALLKRVHYDFYRFELALFHTGIRPEELTSVQIEDVDMVKREIRLWAGNTKTGKNRSVPITQELFEFLIDMDLFQHPKSFYLFGTFRPETERYQGKHKEFVPAPNRLTRSRSTRLWKKYVKDGLGIDVDQYSNKHAGANAMIKSGMSKDSIKRKFGHSSMFTTEGYITELNEILINEIKRSDIRFDE